MLGKANPDRDEATSGLDQPASLLVSSKVLLRVENISLLKRRPLEDIGRGHEALGRSRRDYAQIPTVPKVCLT